MAIQRKPMCFQECFKTFLSSFCDRKIGPSIAVHCVGVICCVKLGNQTTCAVDLMLMAETRSILQALQYRNGCSLWGGSWGGPFFTESLIVAITLHQILYERNIYPPTTFTTTKKYNLPVQQNQQAWSLRLHQTHDYSRPPCDLEWHGQANIGSHLCARSAVRAIHLRQNETVSEMTCYDGEANPVGKDSPVSGC